MKIDLNIEQRAYLFNILQRLAFKSGEVNGRPARRRVQKIAEQLDPKREVVPDLSRTQVDSLQVLLNGYAVVATSVKNNPNTEKDKLEFINKSLKIIKEAQEIVNDKLNANQANQQK